ncbi:hypothetical protein [Neobacillus novalis]|nr:hypothetical protein [Neobacillus novalis]
MEVIAMSRMIGEGIASTVSGSIRLVVAPDGKQRTRISNKCN